MDTLFQRHAAKHIYVIPEGLRELMSDISREVLRSQPEKIYSFIADYLDALMITRENARVAARFVESMTEVAMTIAELLVQTGMSREEADNVATIIQAVFRKHTTDKSKCHQPKEEDDEATIVQQILEDGNISMEQAKQAASIIQNAYCQFKKQESQASDLLKGMVDWRVAARSTMRLYRKTGVTNEEANRAATLIKAAYKGYYTRRIMHRLLKESEKPVESEMKSEEFDYISLKESQRLEIESSTSGTSNVGLHVLNKLIEEVAPETSSKTSKESSIPSVVASAPVAPVAEELTVDELIGSEKPLSEGAVSEDEMQEETDKGETSTTVKASETEEEEEA